MCKEGSDDDQRWKHIYTQKSVETKGIKSLP